MSWSRNTNQRSCARRCGNTRRTASAGRDSVSSVPKRAKAQRNQTVRPSSRWGRPGCTSG
eukprot:11191285-Lingulodinium_polyedra.AAC.1